MGGIAAHIRDVTTQRDDPKTFAFWPSVPVGDGLVQLPEMLALLKGSGYAVLLAMEIDYQHPQDTGEDMELVKSLGEAWYGSHVEDGWSAFDPLRSVVTRKSSHSTLELGCNGERVTP